MKKAALTLLILVFARDLAAQANTIACPPTGQELVQLSEAKSVGTTLNATVSTTAAQVLLPTGAFGKPVVCYAQWVREYRLGWPSAPGSGLANPTPGPILRASVGDLVKLTFLNLIDPNQFPNSDKGCDKTSTYPITPPLKDGDYPDEYPNCFALSTTTNIHYHGTHTNPRSTGDNVFLDIKPSPRSQSTARVPVVTPDLISGPFKDFFDKCEVELSANNVPKQWPRFWRDLPTSLQDLENGLLSKYAPDLLKKNEDAIIQGAWPQYYIGNYPYCFRLPKYTNPTWPPAPSNETQAAHTAGAGSAEHDEAAMPERPLIMGQAPGTHWYHAHKHGSTTINVLNGMSGIFIIEDKSPLGYDGFIADQYKAYPGFSQKVLLVNQLGATPQLERSGGGAPGPNFAVNGRMQPKITMKGGEVQLWRIANNSSRSGIYILAAKSGELTWKQTAQDGVQFADQNYQNSNSNKPLSIAPGGRADLLVKAPMRAGTYQFMVGNTVDSTDIPPFKPNAPVMSLLSVQVDSNGPDMPFMSNAPPMPPYLKDIGTDEVMGTNTLTFANSGTAPAGTPIANRPAKQTINGHKFDGSIGASVRLNRVEEWTIKNESFNPKISHPFHIHINPFQIVEVFDPNAALPSALGAGTVTTTAKSTTVTGSGFKTSAHVGDFIWINGENPGTIVSIESDTSLTSTVSARGFTGATYTIAVPRYTINPPRQGQCQIDPTNPKPCLLGALPSPRIWWDVFPIPSGNTFFDAAGTAVNVPGHFKMRSRFVDYAGHFVSHCHILAHEDRGMMTIIEVSPLQPPMSHH